MLSNFIGDRVRVIIYNRQNELEIDLMCKELSKDIATLFNQFKYIGFHKTLVTETNVIELVKE